VIYGTYTRRMQQNGNFVACRENYWISAVPLDAQASMVPSYLQPSIVSCDSQIDMPIHSCMNQFGLPSGPKAPSHRSRTRLEHCRANKKGAREESLVPTASNPAELRTGGESCRHPFLLPKEATTDTACPPLSSRWVAVAQNGAQVNNDRDSKQSKQYIVCKI
jgi:hypothetical protein